MFWFWLKSPAFRWRLAVLNMARADAAKGENPQDTLRRAGFYSDMLAGRA